MLYVLKLNFFITIFYLQILFMSTIFVRYICDYIFFTSIIRTKTIFYAEFIIFKDIIVFPGIIRFKSTPEKREPAVFCAALYQPPPPPPPKPPPEKPPPPPLKLLPESPLSAVTRKVESISDIIRLVQAGV